ncbi:FecR family protein [Arcticibacter tournemirensis]|uniref:DUF4974 domain-containing protein n=1 Tax=Arcticibacter tournemirensis TaxID=699437 RepID=A0A4Q0MGW2_9SPHI|nr:FecR family protein [Arcticibacter tournemirensis]KAA8482776.1 DUF4974 domain-containing protein [Arcticibacter tournemirensis]RXF72206.1 FecR family protein [Arcticibacter tournemirensis]TQM51077.1 FecR family protein [Arcticibacter tournemirensis]
MEKRKFQKIVTKYLSGKASAEEEKLLVNYLDSFQKDNEGWNLPEMGEEEIVGNELYQKTLQEIKSREERGKVFRLRWLSAAAFVLVFLSGLYYTLQNRNPVLTSKAERFKNDVLPGTSKATLVLADGRHITLDGKENGELTNEAGVIIKKTKEGQLIYDLSKSPSSSANASDIIYNIVSTPKGGKYMLMLEDGTKIWLNSASSLRFPVEFIGNTRSVELTGEAYFEVAKNRQKPFLVKSRGTEVKVLGTHFNISSYENDPAVKATLLEGSVEVSNNHKKVLLKPGNQAGISNTGIKIIENADTEMEMAWKNGFFQFKDARLKDIMRQLSRWYDVEFEYSGKLPDEEFTGIIAQSVKISKVLEMLEQGGGVAFRIEGRKITVTSTQE